MRLKTLSTVLLVSCFWSSLCLAANKTYGEINDAKYVNNYDGDTITVDLPGVHPLFGYNITVRINGIDTPERKGKCAKEKALAMKAKSIVSETLANAKDIKLVDVGRDKYFRINATVIADGVDIGALLLKSGLAVPYDGGTKTKNWCK